VTAALVLVAFALQVVITVRAPADPPGHAVGTLAGASLATRLIRVLSFFTIQSNLLVAITSLQLARRPDRGGRGWSALRVASLVGITVTGIVYATVLARVHEPTGWDQVVSNAVLHYLVPVLALLGWVLFGPRPRVDRGVVAIAVIWPVAWLGYTLVHGAVSGWYPYPFIDVAALGYRGVAVNCLGVLLVFAFVAGLVALGDRRLRHAGKGELRVRPSPLDGDGRAGAVAQKV
jgi:hypothetical protein